MMNDQSFVSRPSLSGNGHFSQSYLMSTLGRQQTTFSFLLIKIPEIIMCLSELGISICEDELTHPENHRESVRRILEHLAEIFTGISRDEIIQPAFSGLSMLNYPELHEDSIPVLNSFRVCNKLMEVCGISDFSVKDLLMPTTKRLVKILSGIINYAKFREERLNVIADLNDHREETMQRLTQAREANEKLNFTLQKLREKNKEDEKVIIEVDKECKAIKNKINILNEKQAEMRDESTRLKSLGAKLKESSLEKSKKIKELQELKENYSNQIVTSPQKFKKQMADVNLSLQNENRDIKAIEKNSREFSAWIESVDQSLSDVNAALSAVQELKVETDRNKNFVTELENLHLTIHNKKQILQELQQNIQQSERQYSRLEKKTSDFKKQSSQQANNFQIKIDDYDSKISDAEKKKTVVRIDISL